MRILQFKRGGDFAYNVSFETVCDKRKLQTNDEPTGSLNSATLDVTAAAIKFYRLSGILSVFRQITFSYPDNDHENFVLELVIKSKENGYVAHTLKTEKLSLNNDVFSDNADGQLRMEQKNDLTEKIIKFREEIEAYVKGARNQQELSFNENNKNEADLFDDEQEENE